MAENEIFTPNPTEAPLKTDIKQGLNSMISSIIKEVAIPAYKVSEKMGAGLGVTGQYAFGNQAGLNEALKDYSAAGLDRNKNAFEGAKTAISGTPLAPFANAAPVNNEPTKTAETVVEPNILSNETAKNFGMGAPAVIEAKPSEERFINAETGADTIFGTKPTQTFQDLMDDNQRKMDYAESARQSKLGMMIDQATKMKTEWIHDPKGGWKEQQVPENPALAAALPDLLKQQGGEYGGAENYRAQNVEMKKAGYGLEAAKVKSASDTAQKEAEIRMDALKLAQKDKVDMGRLTEEQKKNYIDASRLMYDIKKGTAEEQREALQKYIELFSPEEEVIDPNTGSTRKVKNTKAGMISIAETLGPSAPPEAINIYADWKKRLNNIVRSSGKHKTWDENNPEKYFNPQALETYKKQYTG